MPRATAVVNTEHYELKSLPGGWIEVRRLTYGETLRRRSMMTMEFAGDPSKGDARAEMAMMNAKATEFDFARCVKDHNLFADDEETRKLNLGTRADLDQLDPRVGQEIEQILDKLNNFDDSDVAEGNFSDGSETSSS